MMLTAVSVMFIDEALSGRVIISLCVVSELSLQELKLKCIVNLDHCVEFLSTTHHMFVLLLLWKNIVLYHVYTLVVIWVDICLKHPQPGLEVS